MCKPVGVLLLVLMSLGACNLLDDTGKVQVHIDRLDYALGDTLGARLSNFTDESLFFENCCGPLFLRIEQWKDGTWITLPGTCFTLCQSVPAEVASGETRPIRSTYQPSLNAPGRYRLTASYWRKPIADVAAEQASSAPFTVE